MATQPDKGKGRMATIERFEDLQSWQKGRQIANQVYDLTVHAGFSKDFRLQDQIQDAAGSVMHNIAEGLMQAQISSSFAFSRSPGVLPAKCNLNFIWRSTANT
jgi:hypothetical protein